MPFRPARTLAVVGATVALIGASLSMPLVAQADPPSSSGDLQSAVGVSGSYSLGADIVDDQLYTTGDDTTVAIDLHGHTLDAARIELGSGAQLTITDTTSPGGTLTVSSSFGLGSGIIVSTGQTLIIGGHAHVTATGSEGNPGIGGSTNGNQAIHDAGTITIQGDAVVTSTAASSSGVGAAGIGGSPLGSGGAVTIKDNAVVTATGSSLSTTSSGSGAGIGGGNNAPGGSVLITGAAVVHATGGPGGAAIGGGKGLSANGGGVTISGTASVTALSGIDSTPGGALASALGGGEGASTNGAVTIGSTATLTMPTNSYQKVTSGESFTNNGTIVNGGTFIGVDPARIVNNGTITSGGIVQVSVTNHNYNVNMFVGDGALAEDVSSSVPFLAATMDAAGVSLPSPTRSGYTFVGWRFAGSSTTVTGDTDFTTQGSSSDGLQVDVDVDAAYEFIKLPSTTTLALSPTSPIYGSPAQVTATVTAGATGPVSYAFDGAAPSLIAQATASTVDVPAQLAVGAHTVTASYGGDDTYLPSTVTASFTVTGIPTTTSLALSAATARYGTAVTATPTTSTGGSLTVALDGAPIGTVASGASISVPTTTVPGVHTITASYAGDATHAASSASATVNITKVTPTVSITAKKFAPHTKPKLTVKIGALPSGVSATGTVVVKSGKKTVGTGTLTNGIAKITLKKKYATSLKVKASYAGSVGIAAATSAKVKIAVKKSVF